MNLNQKIAESLLRKRSARESNFIMQIHAMRPALNSFTALLHFGICRLELVSSIRSVCVARLKMDKKGGGGGVESGGRDEIIFSSLYGPCPFVSSHGGGGGGKKGVEAAEPRRREREMKGCLTAD